MGPLAAWLGTQTDILAESLDAVIRDALPEYERLRGEGKKGELSHIYLSFLRSGVLCKTPLLRLDLLDENNLNDVTECAAAWDVPVLSDKLYRDAETQATQRDRVPDYELEQMRLDAAAEYDQTFERVLPKVIERCSAVPAGCQWHFRAIPMGNRDDAGKRYFRLGQDNRMPYGVLLPKPSSVPGYKESRAGDLSALPNAAASFIPSSPVNFYPDILDRQIFMVKGAVKEVFDLFIPALQYKHCCLIDKPNDRVEIYYIPLLKLLDPEEGFKRELDIFRVKGTREIEVYASLEVVEAVLRRGSTGIRIRPVQ